MPKFTDHLHICMHETRKKLHWLVNKCTGCYKLILLTLYSGLAAAVRWWQPLPPPPPTPHLPPPTHTPTPTTTTTNANANLNFLKQPIFPRYMRGPGRPRTRWWSTAKKDLQNWLKQKCFEFAHGRMGWQSFFVPNSWLRSQKCPDAYSRSQPKTRKPRPTWSCFSTSVCSSDATDLSRWDNAALSPSQSWAKPWNSSSS